MTIRDLLVTLKNDEFFLNYLEILEQIDLRSCFKKPVASNAKHDSVGILAVIILAAAGQKRRKTRHPNREQLK